ncbi:hypothetical protein M9Y10_042577 [Tritrichomonas musculus]|uniref:Protein kinase domain-containing protein n=1 Tax=Tritrichomonas musculus TaxID=1915356 RepID=A0ABR2JX89_9EUKA
MFQSFLSFPIILINKNIKIKNQKLNSIFSGYSFIHLSVEFDFNKNQSVINNFNESKLAIIHQFTKENINVYVICFKKTLMIFDDNSISLLQTFLSENSNLTVYFLFRQIPEYFNIIKNQKIIDNIFIQEISNFDKKFVFNKRLNDKMEEIWKTVRSCISGYLIKESYTKLNKNRLIDFNNKNENNHEESAKWDISNFIELRNIENSFCSLVYHIEKEELFAIKKANPNDNESQLLNSREIENYTKIKHPFIANFYGTVKDTNHLIIEYINGNTLSNIASFHFDSTEKIILILELILIFQYIRDENYIYRDLKPSNVMIDKNKTLVLIDFNRMIKLSNEGIQTNDFTAGFSAPEIQFGKATEKSDVYSLGQMIYFIINEEIPQKEKKFKKMEIKYQKIYEMCTDINPEKRPSIFKLFCEIFLIVYNNEIYISLLENVLQGQINLGIIYMEGKYIPRNINKSIYYFAKAANARNVVAQFILGTIYFADEYIPRDIDKAIYYFTEAAKQNNKQAQYNLGYIYSKDVFTTRDMNKAIYFYSLAADQNEVNSQYNLGIIYAKGQYVFRDINKAIFYFKLAAKQNHAMAQYNLGSIYNHYGYDFRDINKAIRYYTLAADQNISSAQHNLGIIYEKGEGVSQDINKAIHYYTLAADQGDSFAQYNLGLIYEKGEYVSQDINKTIHYYTLAADQDHIFAQYNLGLIYEKGELVPQDINKAIYYYTLAANQEYPLAQYNLGVIYESGIFIPKDIPRAIYYYTLASDQNIEDAQLNLGIIYLSRNINKALHYFELAANQNNSNALYNLGVIYSSNKYISQDIKKSIYYFTEAANQNDEKAQYALGLLYIFGYNIFGKKANVPININKAIYYFTQAANKNNDDAQYALGVFYLNGIYVKQNIKKGFFMFSLSAKNRNIDSYFVLGFLYHEGKYIEKNIEQSIHCYKEASSFNHFYAKNNLGIIYKHGFGAEIQPNIVLAIEYFNEAIHKSNDMICMYNLAHLYFYENKENDAIDLLIQSCKLGFHPSKYLLILSLIKKFQNRIDVFMKELEELIDKSSKLFSDIYQLFINHHFDDILSYNVFYQYFKKIDYLYDHLGLVIMSTELKEREQEKPKYKNINSEFYIGFEIDI